MAIVKNPRYEGAIIAVNSKDKEEEKPFIDQFKDTLYTVLAEGIANRLGELIASNEDKWITIHPHGKESDDYRRLRIMDGETVEDAMHRQGYYDKRKAKDEKKEKEQYEDIYQKDIDNLMTKRAVATLTKNKGVQHGRNQSDFSLVGCVSTHLIFCAAFSLKSLRILNSRHIVRL